ncbi:MAG TPA: hypothetical protein VK626_01665 [Nitrospiraceae bacterium]|nr:hypothetical protein [Nitrospiraceae bacterium]
MNGDEDDWMERGWLRSMVYGCSALIVIGVVWLVWSVTTNP